MLTKTEMVHVSAIRSGDTVNRAGNAHTVCAKDIKRIVGIGITLFGDSYKLGTQLVQRVLIQQVRTQLSTNP
jgi:hypothetical protein